MVKVVHQFCFMKTFLFRFCLVLLLAGVFLPSGFAQANAKKIIDYFIEAALGSEFNNSHQRIKKWRKDIHYYVIGKPHPEYEAELRRVIDELHALTGLTFTEAKRKRDANLLIVFGSADTYVKIEPQAKKYTDKNWGLFFTRWNGLGEIYYATMYVDVFRAKGNQVKHLIREELTQLLGLMRDSYRYKKSIFYQGWTTYTDYAPIDKILIRLLYHPDMPMNADEATAREAAARILKEMDLEENLFE
ncbi:MAG: hypothetical protein KatS3mg033_0470 [Thermonema sp.]|nr:MAG: hypothetical protein KatS3mg033_0470 [Thermonema sp.]